MGAEEKDPVMDEDILDAIEMEEAEIVSVASDDIPLGATTLKAPSSDDDTSSSGDNSDSSDEDSNAGFDQTEQAYTYGNEEKSGEAEVYYDENGYPYYYDEAGNAQ